MQRFLILSVLLFALGWQHPAHALGFGRVSSQNILGQRLDFAVQLRLDPSESASATGCIGARVTTGDRVLPGEYVHSRVEITRDGSEQWLRVRTTVAIEEPVLVVQVRVGCSSRLERSYTLFADPPGAAPARDGSEPDTVEINESSPLLSVLPPDTASKARTAPRAARPQGTALPAAGEAASAARRPASGNEVAKRPKRGAAAPTVARSTPVLRLDPLEYEALTVPPLRMATTLSNPPDPSASAASAPRFLDPEQLQRQREIEQLKAMEASLEKLRVQNQATQRSLTEVQGRLNESESRRYANPLIYGLVALCAVLLVGVAALLYLRRRDGAAAAWWTAEEEAQVRSQIAPDPQPEAEPEPEAPQSTISDAMPLIASAPTPLPPVASPMLQTVAVPAYDSGPSRTDSDGPRRPMSAEELIDLEQQAEFFIVLGQDDAAIDLLMGHVRQTGGVSPLPYMKLLEIYRRRAELEPYNRIRERFNHRFNAYAPEWQVDPETGLDLEGYPEILSRVQRAWDAPSHALALLDAALFRRNAGPTFDLPAYRDLLFLYGIARDLAEFDERPEGVDLLLDLGADSGPSMLINLPPSASPLATLPLPTRPPAPPMVAPPAEDEPPSLILDLDVSSDRPPLLDEDPLAGFERSSSGTIDFDLDPPPASPKKPGPR
jgi:hypothetical protein